MKDKRLEMFNDIERIKSQELKNNIDLDKKINYLEHNISLLQHNLSLIKNQLESYKKDIFLIQKQKDTNESRIREILSELQEIMHEKSITHSKIEKITQVINESSNHNSQSAISIEQEKSLHRERLALFHSLNEFQLIESNLESRLAHEQSHSFDLENKLKESTSKYDELNHHSNRLEREIAQLNQEKNAIYTQQFSHKNSDAMTVSQQNTIRLNENESHMLDILTALFLNKISIGNTIKKLRVNILKINQEQFGKLVGVSRKTISEIENDRGNLSADSLSAIMKPFNLRLTLLPTSNDLLEQFKNRINQ